jgi:hypothetical protein
MKTQDTGTAGTQATPPSHGRSRRSRWLAGIGAIIVVALLIGASALIFAQLRQRQASQAAPTPSAGQWKQVLKGYTLTSLVAARNNPAVLYACAVQSATSQSSPATITVLRSTDFGDHWQDIGSKAALNETCQIAVNPADGNEIYAISIANNAQGTEVLKHSTDGGQTWETIQPVLHVPASQATALWIVQQIQLEGNHLFGVQWLIPRAKPVDLPVRAFPFLLPRLVTSVDGGHNWTVIDNQFAAQQLGVHSYAVDPTNPNTIYDLAGQLLLPLKDVPTYDPLPYTGLNQQLFKTTDGGATWQRLLNDMPYGSQVQLATANPQLIYVGGTIGPLPLAPGAAESPYPDTAGESKGRPQGSPLHTTPLPPLQGYGEISPAVSYPTAPGSFHLQFSTNGGTAWKNVAIPSDMQSIQSWFVSPGGQVYASPTIPFSAQPTTITITAVPATPVPGNYQYAGLPVHQEAPSAGAQSNAPAGAQTEGVPITTSQPIRRYDPTTDSWSDVTRPPVPGFMLQLTPAQANSGAILWFTGTTSTGQTTLYRFVA